MAIKAGRFYLLQVGDGGSPETYATVAGLQVTNHQIANAEVDTTTKDDNGNMTLLGVKTKFSMTINAEGRPDDVDVTQDVLDKAFSGTLHNFRLIYNSDGTTFDTYEFAGQITSYERAGDVEDAETFSLTIMVSGEVTRAVDQTS